MAGKERQSEGVVVVVVVVGVWGLGKEVVAK